jgi:hypothetical protein
LILTPSNLAHTDPRPTTGEAVQLATWRVAGAVERGASAGRRRRALRVGRRSVEVLDGASGGPDRTAGTPHRGRTAKRTRRGLKSPARSGASQRSARRGPPSERVKNPRPEGSRPPAARSAPAQAETVHATILHRAWPGRSAASPSPQRVSA